MQSNRLILRNALVIFLGALLFHAVVHPFVLVGGDEGRYAQDAMRVLGGEWPIADFTTRTPILLTVTAFSVKLFGMSLVSLRLPGILASALIAVFVYLLARSVWGERVGRWSVMLYILLPFTLWQNVVIKSESLTVFFTVIAAYFLLKSTHTNSMKWLVFAGVGIGLAVIERLSALAFLFSTILYLLFTLYDATSLQKSLKRYGLAFFCLGGGALFGWLSVGGVLMLRNVKNVVGFYFSPFLINAVTESREYVFNGIEFLRSWALVFVESLASQAGPIVIGTTIFFWWILRERFGSWGNRLGACFSCGVMLVFFVHTMTILYYGTFHINVFLLTLAGVLLVCGGIVFAWKVPTQGVDVTGAMLFPLWVCGHIITYSFFVPGYPRELIVPMVIMTAVVGERLLGEGRRMSQVRLIVGLGAVLLWIGGALWYQNPRVGGWWWSQKTMNDVASYIHERTSPEDRIFAANPLPVVLAERRTVLNMNPYAVRLAAGGDVRWGSFPTPNEYYQALVTSPPKYTIVDGRMEGQYYGTYSMFKEFVENNYQPVQTFWTGERRGKVVIWEYHPK